MPGNARKLIEAFLSAEVDTAAAYLSSDATFRSPIDDYFGAERIREVWHAVSGVITRPQQKSVYEGDYETVVFFSAEIKGKTVQGVIRTESNESDEVAELVLWIRPFASLIAGLADVEL